ncbi:hypothetical protein NHQ30_005940 [Ciborinia camelliae]|nr:hypothetical protein NHQ30_005940 [Ciborinia camelliae]
MDEASQVDLPESPALRLNSPLIDTQGMESTALRSTANEMIDLSQVDLPESRTLKLDSSDGTATQNTEDGEVEDFKITPKKRDWNAMAKSENTTPTKTRSFSGDSRSGHKPHTSFDLGTRVFGRSGNRNVRSMSADLGALSPSRKSKTLHGCEGFNLEGLDNLYGQDSINDEFEAARSAESQIIVIPWGDGSLRYLWFASWCREVMEVMEWDVEDIDEDDDMEWIEVVKDSQEAIDLVDKLSGKLGKSDLSKELLLCVELKCRIFLKDISTDKSIDQGASLANILGVNDASADSRMLNAIQRTFKVYENDFNKDDILERECTFALMEFDMLTDWEADFHTSMRYMKSSRNEAYRMTDEFTQFFVFTLGMTIFADVVMLAGMGKLRCLKDGNDRTERLEFWERELSNTTMLLFWKVMRHCLNEDDALKQGTGQTYVRKHLARFADDVFRFQVVRPKICSFSLDNIPYFTKIISGRRTLGIIARHLDQAPDLPPVKFSIDWWLQRIFADDDASADRRVVKIRHDNTHVKGSLHRMPIEGLITILMACANSILQVADITIHQFPCPEVVPGGDWEHMCITRSNFIDAKCRLLDINNSQNLRWISDQSGKPLCRKITSHFPNLEPYSTLPYCTTLRPTAILTIVAKLKKRKSTAHKPNGELSNPQRFSPYKTRQCEEKEATMQEAINYWLDPTDTELSSPRIACRLFSLSSLSARLTLIFLPFDIVAILLLIKATQIEFSQSSILTQLTSQPTNELHNALAFEVVDGRVIDRAMPNDPVLDSVEACTTYDHVLANVMKAIMDSLVGFTGDDDDAKERVGIDAAYIQMAKCAMMAIVLEPSEPAEDESDDWDRERKLWLVCHHVSHVGQWVEEFRYGGMDIVSSVARCVHSFSRRDNFSVEGFHAARCLPQGVLASGKEIHDKYDAFHSVFTYCGWPDFSIRNFFGTAQETLWIAQYAEMLRNTPIKAQFCGANNASIYFMSFLLPSLPIPGGPLFTLEASVFVHFRKNPTLLIPKSKQAQKEAKEQGGWEGSMIETSRIQHPGSHLMLVTRSAEGLPDSDYDVHAAIWRPNHDPTLPSSTKLITVYLRLDESFKSVKARVNAISMWAPDHKPPALPLESDEATMTFSHQTEFDSGMEDIERFTQEEDDSLPSALSTLGYTAYMPPVHDFKLIRELLYGHGLQDHRKAEYRDLTYGLPANVVTSTLARCGADERRPRILKSCLLGILIVVGPAGTGKTTLTIVLIHLALRKGFSHVRLLPRAGGWYILRQHLLRQFDCLSR